MNWLDNQVKDGDILFNTVEGRHCVVVWMKNEHDSPRLALVNTKKYWAVGNMVKIGSTYRDMIPKEYQGAYQFDEEATEIFRNGRNMPEFAGSKVVKRWYNETICPGDMIFDKKKENKYVAVFVDSVYEQILFVNTETFEPFLYPKEDGVSFADYIGYSVINDYELVEK